MLPFHLLLIEVVLFHHTILTIDNFFLLYPLKETTVIKINRQLKSGITDEQLATMIVSLRDNNSLCIIHPEDVPQEARIICSLGLFSVP